MSELVQEFAKTTTFKYFYSTLMRFDADLNCFVSTDKLRDRDAELLTAAWWMFQERQTKFYEMKTQLNNMETCYIEKKKEVEELRGQIDEVLQEVKGLERFMGEDCIADFDVLQGAVSHACKRLEKALRGGHV